MVGSGKYFLAARKKKKHLPKIECLNKESNDKIQKSPNASYAFCDVKC